MYILKIAFPQLENKIKLNINKSRQLIQRAKLMNEREGESKHTPRVFTLIAAYKNSRVNYVHTRARTQTLCTITIYNRSLCKTKNRVQSNYVN